MFSRKHCQRAPTFLLTILGLAALCAPPAAAREPTTYTYSIVKIPSLGPGAQTWPYSINAWGEVVGVWWGSSVDGGAHAFLYTGGAESQDLNPPGNEVSSLATGINDFGVVAIEDRRNGFNVSLNLFRYSKSEGTDVWENLGTFDSNGVPQQIRSKGIHNSGVIAGSYYPAADNPLPGGERSFVYIDGKGFVDIGTLGGDLSEDDYARARAINKGTNGKLQVVGISRNAEGHGHAFRYTYIDGGGNDIWEDLGVLLQEDKPKPPYREGDPWSSAYAMNDVGQVVGIASKHGFRHLFRYTDGVGMEDLGPLYPGWVWAINNWGDVVGENGIVVDDRYIPQAFRYADGVGMEDLNCLIEPDPGDFFRNVHPLGEAAGINDAGQIIVIAPIESYRDDAYLLTPNLPSDGAPVEPSNLTATTVSSSAIDLAWTDNSNDETGFRIDVKGPDRCWTFVGTVGADATTFRVTGLNKSTLYYCRLRAENAAGASLFRVASTSTDGGGGGTKGGGGGKGGGPKK